MKNKRVQVLSYVEKMNIDGTIKKVEATLLYELFRIKVSINETSTQNYSYRGRIVVKDVDGKNFKIKRKDKNGNMKDAELSFQIFYQTCEMKKEIILSKIENKVRSIFVDNATLFLRSDISILNPQNITLSIAIQYFGESYLKKTAKNYKNPEKYVKEKIRVLKNMCAKLPSKPMSKISKKMIENSLRGFERASFLLLNDFWQNCIDELICDGVNPVVVPPKKKRNKRKRAREKMSEYKELTNSEQILFMQEIEKDPKGYKLGLAIILGTGCSGDDAIECKWADISFELLNQYVADDFAIYRRSYKRKNCPIRNGSIVITPWVALVLRKKYDMLKLKFGKEKVDKMYVVSKMEDESCKLDKKTFNINSNNFVRKFLKEKSENYIDISKLLLKGEAMKISSAIKLLQRTFESNLKRLNFVDNPEKVEFLLGKISYIDSSSLNYISFTSPDAYLGYYSAFKVLGKIQKLEKVADYVDDNGNNVKTSVPLTSINYCSQEVEIILNPGEEISFEADGGVRCEYSSK